MSEVRSVSPHHRLFAIEWLPLGIVRDIGELRNYFVEDVRKILEPLFMLFDFMKFDDKVYEEIATEFVKGRAT